MGGLEWLEASQACDLLRVTEDNADIVEQHAAGIAAYVETTTGYPAELAQGVDCDETVKALCRFLLMLWFNPDGTDADRLQRVIDALTKAVRALVVAGEA